MRRKRAKKPTSAAQRRASAQARFSPETVRRVVAQLWDLGEPLCEYHGIELVHVECRRESSGRTIRLYIDKPGGVGLDDCTVISRAVDDALDVHLDLKEAYRLEVSSPGAQRPLGKAADFDRFKGSRVKITVAKPIDGRRNFSGTLMGLEEGAVKITVNDKTIAFPYPHITKAHLVRNSGDD